MGNNAIVTSVELFMIPWHDRWGEQGAFLSLTEEGVLTQALKTAITIAIDYREEGLRAACAAYLGIEVEDENYSPDDLNRFEDLVENEKEIGDKMRFLRLLDEYGATEDVFFPGEVEKAILTED